MRETTEPMEPMEWDGKAPIPVEQWGRDHWSTLAYVETRCVDHGGAIDGDRMRTNWRRHRTLVGRQVVKRATMFGGTYSADPKYPTRLAGNVVVPRHDDWDCVQDAEAAGLLVVVEEREWPRWGSAFGGTTIVVRLTDAGQAMAAQLRAHKAHGGTYSNFTATVEAPDAAAR